MLSWGTGFHQNYHQPNNKASYQSSFPPLEGQQNDPRKETPIHNPPRWPRYENGYTKARQRNNPLFSKRILDEYGIQKDPTTNMSRGNNTFLHNNKQENAILPSSEDHPDLESTPGYIDKTNWFQRRRGKRNAIQAGSLQLKLIYGQNANLIKENFREEEEQEEDVFQHNEETLASFECVCGKRIPRPSRQSPTFCSRCLIVLLELCLSKLIRW